MIEEPDYTESIETLSYDVPNEKIVDKIESDIDVFLLKIFYVLLLIFFIVMFIK